jgi:hypothetical protein
MDNSSQRPGSNSETQPTHSFFAASLQIFENILDRLAGIFKLTEEEEWEAGIYLGEQPANNYQHSQYSESKEQHNGN